MLKSLALLAPCCAGALYVGGAFDGGWSREVARSPELVATAIEDLDIRRQPGAPGTDPSRSGGVPAVFVTERTPDGVAFTVMSGSQVATRMSAHLRPSPDGARTRVTATVERGDAPDAQTSPAFRSEALTMRLFVAALDDELNALTRPPGRSAADCARLMDEMVQGRDIPSGPAAIVRLNQMAAELERQGCDTSAPVEFQEVTEQLRPARAVAGGWGPAAGGR